MTSSPMKLLYLVTGANKGIGKEIVSQIFPSAPRGAQVRVLLTARNFQDGKEAMNEFTREGKDVHAIQLDINEDQSVSNMVQSKCKC